MTGTIVLIHGLWVTPRSWEGWRERYEARGYRVVTPTYAGWDGHEVEDLRADPDLIANCSIEETKDQIAAEIAALDEPPIIMGHSFGGTLTQLMLARGLGRAGVVIDSAPTEGVRVSPLSQVRSLFPALRNPANAHRATGFTAEEWHYAFANTLSREESDAAYERYAIAAPGRWVWAYGLVANLKPGHQETWVDYANDARAPLLFVAGGADHIMPPSVNRSNHEHYAGSAALTEYHEFEGRDHWTCAAPGWEAVADHALEWAEKNSSTAHITAG